MRDAFKARTAFAAFEQNPSVDTLLQTGVQHVARLKYLNRVWAGLFIGWAVLVCLPLGSCALTGYGDHEVRMLWALLGLLAFSLVDVMQRVLFCGISGLSVSLSSRLFNGHPLKELGHTEYEELRNLTYGLPDLCGYVRTIQEHRPLLQFDLVMAQYLAQQTERRLAANRLALRCTEVTDA